MKIGRVIFLLVSCFGLLIACNDEEYNRGYQAGYERAKSEWFAEGVNQGRQEGTQSGYNSGYEVGLSEGTVIGYNDGKEEGYVLGKNDGFGDGIEQAEALALIRSEQAISSILTGQCPCIQASIYTSLDDNLLLNFLTITSLPIILMVTVVMIVYILLLINALSNTQNSVFGFMFGFTASVLLSALVDVRLLQHAVPFLLSDEYGIYLAAAAMAFIGYIFSIILLPILNYSNQAIVITLTFFFIPFSREIMFFTTSHFRVENQSFTELYTISSSAFLLGLLLNEVIMEEGGALTWSKNYVYNKFFSV